MCLPSTTGHEQISLEPQVGTIPKVSTIKNDFTRGQLDILVFYAHKVTVFAKLRLIKVRDGNTKLSKTYELFSVETLRVSENTTSVNDSHGLV